ncbi:S-adenosyl-L-methionine-dependent methyltransferases superfamily protein [Wolffia australiana]
METALFSPSSLFHCSDEDDEDRAGGVDASGSGVKGTRKSLETQQQGEETTFVERLHALPGGVELLVREFSFHQHNANFLWPGTFSFSEWLLQNKSCFEGKRILELGSGTGALAIFLKKLFAVDITTSDFDDLEIEENIAHNCAANGLEILPHIRHTWGDPFPVHNPFWDVILASDILLYVKQYPNLLKTLHFLLRWRRVKDSTVGIEVGTPPEDKLVTIAGKEVHLQYPLFLMSWRRRLGKEDEALFFNGCEDASLNVTHLGARIYSISLRRDAE